MATKAEKVTVETLTIPAPRMKTLVITIKGTAPLMVANFSAKTQAVMREKQEAGSQATKGKKRDARDFDLDVENARHVSAAGWDGVNASAFRLAMISACRLVGFKMTLAKLAVFVEADGYDSGSGQPLVRILSDEGYEQSVLPARNATGVFDLRARPMWRNWSMVVRVRFDLDVFAERDVINLMSRVGQQVGIGEGRPDSKMSAGIGFGTFEVVSSEAE
jgi:hypothetical protein